MFGNPSGALYGMTVALMNDKNAVYKSANPITIII